jgi:hypothetical protein
MTSDLLVRGTDGGLDSGEVPAPSPGAAAERTAPPPQPPINGATAPRQAGATNPQHKRPRDASPVKSWAAAAVLLMALACTAAAAVLMSFPQAAGLAHLSRRDLSLLVPAAATTAIIAAIMAWRVIRNIIRGHRTADVLTFLAASVASAVAATGMWRVFSVILHLDLALRLLFFPFIEIAVITSAVRFRDNMRDDVRARDRAGDAGMRGVDVDGMAMWALTCLSAVLSSMAARSPAEALFRLAPPLVAAWLWERSLVSERRRVTGQRIHWRLTPERVLVRLGVAEPTGREVGEVAAERRIMQLALAADQAAALEAASAAGWRRRSADRRLRRTLRTAIKQAELADSESRQQQLVRQIAMLRSYQGLASLAPASPWELLAGELHARNGSGPGDCGQDAGGAPGGVGAGEVPPVDFGAAAQDLAHFMRVFEDLRSLVQDAPASESGSEGSPQPGSRDDQAETQAGAFPHPAGDLGEQAERLAVSLRQTDGSGIHALLAGRDDYPDLARAAADRGKAGSKRLVALIGLYATGQLRSPALAAQWIAAHVDGPGGQVDKSEIRQVRAIVEPLWSSAGYPAQLPETESR